jgi:hypothetical protein
MVAMNLRFLTSQLMSEVISCAITLKTFFLTSDFVILFC